MGKSLKYWIRKDLGSVSSTDEKEKALCGYTSEKFKTGWCLGLTKQSD